MFGSRTNALIVASYWLPKGNLTCTSHMHCRRFGWPICLYLTFAYFPQNPRKRGSCESGREEERESRWGILGWVLEDSYYPNYPKRPHCPEWWECSLRGSEHKANSSTANPNPSPYTSFTARNCCFMLFYTFGRAAWHVFYARQRIQRLKARLNFWGSIMGLPARIVENKGGSPRKCGTEMGGGLGPWLVQKKPSTIFCNPPSYSTLAWHWHALA